jgi:hypothetical protein
MQLLVKDPNPLQSSLLPELISLTRTIRRETVFTLLE